MAPLFPPFLSPNDKVTVVAPAGAVDEEKLDAGIAWLTRRIQPVWHRDILLRERYFAGSDAHRGRAFQEALDNRESRALLTARGGFGTTRILDRLSYNGFKVTPKWVVGSSDLTACLIEIWAMHHIATIHGPMVAGFHHTDEGDLTQLMDLLEGRPWTPPKELEGLVSGSARGPMIGGNLTVLAHLAGTISPNFSDNAILFLEDVQEKPYRLDRALVQLKRSRILENVAGIVLGEFTDCEPGKDGTTALNAMEGNLAPLGIPVARGYPAAHGKRNAPFVHGAIVTLDVQGKSADLKAAGA